jgi:hypothetical protein
MKVRYAYIVLLLCIILPACVDHNASNSPELQTLIAEGVKIRIAEFEEREWEKCMTQALNLAIAEVDSLIRATAKQDAVEPVLKPPKPERPGKRPVKTLPDSIREKAIGEPDTIQY